jgi:hypothetical protein
VRDDFLEHSAFRVLGVEVRGVDVAGHGGEELDVLELQRAHEARLSPILISSQVRFSIYSRPGDPDRARGDADYAWALCRMPPARTASHEAHLCRVFSVLSSRGY